MLTRPNLSTHRGLIPAPVLLYGVSMGAVAGAAEDRQFEAHRRILLERSLGSRTHPETPLPLNQAEEAIPKDSLSIPKAPRVSRSAQSEFGLKSVICTSRTEVLSFEVPFIQR